MVELVPGILEGILSLLIPAQVNIVGAWDAERPAHDQRRQEGGEQNDSHHHCNLRLAENARTRAHCCDDQSDLAAGDHSAPDAEASNRPHAHAQGSESTTDQFADYSNSKDGDK